MEKPDKVCVVDSAYTLFLYLVIFNESINTTMFITADGIPRKILSLLPHHIEFPTFRGSKFPLLRRLIYCFYFLLFKKSKYKGLDKNGVYGQDHLFFSFVFMRKGFILLEDGLGNYIHTAKRKASFIRKLLLRGDEWGYSRNVQSIYLTNLAPVPEGIIKKVITVNIQEAWSNIDKKNKIKILDVFNLDESIAFEQVDVMVMTQPFSEDNVISEREKIEIYEQIISNYDGVVVIKPHPREKTNYKDHFSVPVLDGTIPVQLMLMFNRPGKIVTCFSSISTNDFNIPVDIYGTGICKKLETKYGIFESNINAF
ncbi:glycosyltransferase family 52 [Erwinia pyri]|uniref:Glycosyltransferase family 52 n=1 Tax=Erwinia pyri TaxID=3062598 RepID=A0AA50DNS0_9GAMM|nr:glycosyltransferase family 52 [Erwinia sp. DE2]WLS80308.1 glycosyltransferase family 52 [Erwinia sp. DE2]